MGVSVLDEDRVRQVWARDADSYDRFMGVFERLVLGDARSALCRQARGRTLEVAVGTGANLPHYDRQVDLTGVDLSPEMLAHARAGAETLGRTVELTVGSAVHLPFPDGTFDTVVFTLALCCIQDDRAALAEAHRVLRPGGTLLLLDNVLSTNAPLRALQRLLAGPMLRSTGHHVRRRPLLLLPATGFTLLRRERRRAGLVEMVAAVRV